MTLKCFYPDLKCFYLNLKCFYPNLKCFCHDVEMFLSGSSIFHVNFAARIQKPAYSEKSAGGFAKIFNERS